MDAQEYRCQEDHDEDLTRQVLAILASKGRRTYGFDHSDDEKPHPIVVYCSQGHVNIFDL